MEEEKESVHIIQDQIILARSKLWTPELDKLLRKWKNQTGKREKGHINQHRKYAVRHRIFGAPCAILAYLSSSGAFATFRNCTPNDENSNGNTSCSEEWIRLIAAIMTLIGGILAAFLTFMDYSKSSINHKKAADDFGALFRRLDSLLQIPGPMRGDPPSTLQNIRNNYDELVRNSPSLPSEYDISLDYDLIRNKFSKRLFSKTKDLQKLIKEDKAHPSAMTIDEINRVVASENDYDTEDEEREVKITIDLDEFCSYDVTAAAIAAAEEASRREQEKQESLRAALKFELERLDHHASLHEKNIQSKNKSETHGEMEVEM